MKTVKPANNSPWNNGKLVGQKSPLRLRDIWGIRIRLELAARIGISHSSIWRSIASYEHAT
jgi:hypothetical protein